jgi:apolipoprotein N-acyltransferase
MSRAILEKTELTHDAAATPVLRWYAKVGLCLLSVAMLSLSFAPYKQFYLAWVGLVPLLIVVAHTRSAWSAFFWTWGAGIAFFLLNMWWLYFVTNAGLAALVALLGLYWAVPAMLLRGMGILSPRLAGGRFSPSPHRAGTEGMVRVEPGRGSEISLSLATERRAGSPAKRELPLSVRMLLIAVVWVGFEWLRGTWPLNGLPWLFLGHTQSPALLICQIADLAGVAGVTFLVVMINALVALAILDREIGRLRVAIGILGACAAFTTLYGAWRFSEESAVTAPGPRVMVVQANVRQDNTGNKGESQEDLLVFHLKESGEALSNAPPQDLVVWSETMAPQLNPEVRAFVETRFWDNFLDQAYGAIGRVAEKHNVNLLTGGLRWTGLSWSGDYINAQDRRNVTYLFDRTGEMTQRYDKIHLVPFGEYMPFEHTLPFAYRMLMKLSPYGSGYTLTAGDANALTAFEIHGDSGQTWRFVSPICFEDIDGPLVRKMFAPEVAGGPKRVQFIVNVTNDGWFRGGENSQHLQASIFRAIENRAPIARSVNTGISGFVDSMGRPSDLIAAQTAGTAWEQLRLDSRTTPYTRIGDWLAQSCAAVTGILLIVDLASWFKNRLGRRTKPAVV